MEKPMKFKAKFKTTWFTFIKMFQLILDIDSLTN